MSDEKKENRRNLFRRIAWTIGILVVYNLLTYVTIPGVDRKVLAEISKIPTLTMMAMFSGGGFQKFSLLSMGVGPYITAQIIVQLLQSGVIPKLTEWSKQGQIGRHKLTQLTRALTVVIGFVQAVGIVATLNSLSQVGIFLVDSWWNYLVIGLIWTAGSFIAMWLGDQITQNGLGNGISVIISAGIIKGLPESTKQLVDALSTTAGIKWDLIVLTIVLVIILTTFIVWFNRCEYRLPIQYTRRENNTSDDSYLPLKLIVPGVVPVIFASSILSLPQTVLMFFNTQKADPIYKMFNDFFALQSDTGICLYGILIILFTYVYSLVQVEPDKLAENLSKQEAYIPSIWPGDPTAVFIKNTIFDLDLPGAAFLALISVIPLIVSNQISPSLQLGLSGSSLLIIVGTLADIGRQIEGLKLKEGYYDFLSPSYNTK